MCPWKCYVNSRSSTKTLKKYALGCFFSQEQGWICPILISLEKTLMLGRIEGGRRRQQQDKMVGRHHRFHGHEFEQAPGVGDGQWSLACCSPWRRKESDTTEWLNWYWLTDDESTLRASQVALVVKNPPANAVLSRSVKSNSLRPDELQPTRLLCQWGFSRQEYWSRLLCRTHKRWRFDPWIRNIPWRRAWQPTPVFLPRKFHRQRSLAGYSPFGLKRVRQLKQLGTHTKSTCDWDSQRESQNIHVALF